MSWKDLQTASFGDLMDELGGHLGADLPGACAVSALNLAIAASTLEGAARRYEDKGIEGGKLAAAHAMVLHAHAIDAAQEDSKLYADTSPKIRDGARAQELDALSQSQIRIATLAAELAEHAALLACDLSGGDKRASSGAAARAYCAARTARGVTGWMVRIARWSHNSRFKEGYEAICSAMHDRAMHASARIAAEVMADLEEPSPPVRAWWTLDQAREDELALQLMMGGDDAWAEAERRWGSTVQEIVRRRARDAGIELPLGSEARYAASAFGQARSTPQSFSSPYNPLRQLCGAALTQVLKPTEA